MTFELNKSRKNVILLINTVLLQIILVTVLKPSVIMESNSKITTNLVYIKRSGLLYNGTWHSLIISYLVAIILFISSFEYFYPIIYMEFDNLQKVENTHWTFLYLTLSLLAHQTLSGTNDLILLDKEITSGVYSYSWGRSKEEINLMKKAEKKHTTFARFYFTIVHTAFVFQVIRSSFFNQKRQGWDLLYYSWQPYPIDNWPGYIAGNTYQIVTGLCCTLTITSFFAFISACSEHLIAQIKILKYVLTTYIVPNKDNDYGHLAALKECIIHQQTLYRICSVYQRKMSHSLLLVYINFGVILCTTVYIMIDSTTSLDIILSFIFVLLPEVLLPFSLSWYCQKIYDESEELKDVIYSLDWMSLKPKQRNDLICIMTRCQRPVILKGSGITQCSLKSFQEILTASYSYLNMLRAVRQ